ncbi:MAG: class I SAM-dependent methyltransferase [Pseudonocardia sp.]|jgi:SAM-dependent methyltransferase
MTTVSYRSFTGTAAENYERYFVPKIATPVSVALLEAAALQPGQRVLDVACGTGLIARLAAERVGSSGTVTGLDLSPDMIEVARAASPSTIAWHVGDATSVPFPDDTYDVVFCQMGLMFMPDRQAAVAEMRRVTAPGGRVVVNTPGSIQPPFAIMEQALVDHISADLGGFVRAVFSMHDVDGVASLLRDAGLVDVTAAASTATLDVGAPAEFLWQYINLTPMGPFVAQAPATAQEAMERNVVESWRPFIVDDAMSISQPMVVASGCASTA